MPMVSEADRIKAVERVRDAIAPIFGGTPSYKRKRGIYRALKRGDKTVTIRYEYELGLIEMQTAMLRMFFRDTQDLMKECKFIGLINKKEE